MYIKLNKTKIENQNSRKNERKKKGRKQKGII